MAGEIVEEIDDVRVSTRVAGEQAHVGVETCRLHVIVAGADVHIAAQPARLLAHDERQSSRAS